MACPPHPHPHSRRHFEVTHRIRSLRGRPDSHLAFPGMNAAVRAVTRMGIYVGAKVFLIYEVGVTLLLPDTGWGGNHPPPRAGAPLTPAPCFSAGL